MHLNDKNKVINRSALSDAFPPFGVTIDQCQNSPSTGFIKNKIYTSLWQLLFVGQLLTFDSKHHSHQMMIANRFVIHQFSVPRLLP